MPLFGAQEGLWDIWLDDSTENGTSTRPPGTCERNQKHATGHLLVQHGSRSTVRTYLPNRTAVYDNVG